MIFYEALNQTVAVLMDRVCLVRREHQTAERQEAPRSADRRALRRRECWRSLSRGRYRASTSDR